MSPFTVSLAAFGCVSGGALLGLYGRPWLLADHQIPDTEKVVRLGMGLVGTTVALVLGLLVGSAKGFLDTQNSGVTEAAGNVVLLDRILAHYGPEAKDARTLLHTTIASMVNVAGPRDYSGATHFDPFAQGGSNEGLFDKIQELSPQNEGQRVLKTEALGSAIKLGQTRWLLFVKKSSPLPMPLLAVLVFWLTLLFMSFGLFIRPNVTAVTSLLISALAVSLAIFLIIEMYEPYGGLIHVSDAPLRAALAQLGR